MPRAGSHSAELDPTLSRRPSAPEDLMGWNLTGNNRVPWLHKSRTSRVPYYLAVKEWGTPPKELWMQGVRGRWWRIARSTGPI